MTNEQANEQANPNRVVYNRKRHRYEYYEGSRLIAVSAYMHRLEVEYPDAVWMKDAIPDPEFQVRDLDKEDIW